MYQSLCSLLKKQFISKHCILFGRQFVKIDPFLAIPLTIFSSGMPHNTPEASHYSGGGGPPTAPGNYYVMTPQNSHQYTEQEDFSGYIAG